MIKSLASFAFNTTKRCAEIVEPFTPTFVKSRVVKVVAFAEKLVEKPYQTSKEVLPAPVFNAGEKAWNNYGVVAVSKTQSVITYSHAKSQAVVLYATTTVKKAIHDLTTILESAQTYVKHQVTSTVAFVQQKLSDSKKYTLVQGQAAYQKAFLLVKSFSGKQA